MSLYNWLPPVQAADQRGTTPLLAAYKNGCVDVVDWLLGQVAHLPSDQECQKALMSPMPADTDLLPQRSKCLELIMKVYTLTLLLHDVLYQHTLHDIHVHSSL